MIDPIRGTPRIAYKLGCSVGMGLSPGRAAVCRYLSRRELVGIRINYWQDYDRGLVDGKEGRQCTKKKVNARVLRQCKKKKKTPASRTTAHG